MTSMNARLLLRRIPLIVRAYAPLVGLLLVSYPALAVEIGDTPPDFLGKSEDGKRIVLSESVGKIRIVTFWATWCAPCLKELPVLNVVQIKGGADRIQVIAVNINDRKNSFRKAMRIFDDYEIEFVYDWKGRVAEKYGVEGIPHMLIIDVDGRIAYRHIGYSESAIPGFVDEINGLLVKNNLVNTE